MAGQGVVRLPTVPPFKCLCIHSLLPSTLLLARPCSGVFSFDGREWEVVTEAAKDMITQMLVMDFTKRATAKQLLAHRWFQVRQSMGAGYGWCLSAACGACGQQHCHHASLWACD